MGHIPVNTSFVSLPGVFARKRTYSSGYRESASCGHMKSLFAVPLMNRCQQNEGKAEWCYFATYCGSLTQTKEFHSNLKGFKTARDRLYRIESAQKAAAVGPSGQSREAVTLASTHRMPPQPASQLLIIRFYRPSIRCRFREGKRAFAWRSVKACQKGPGTYLARPSPSQHSQRRGAHPEMNGNRPRPETARKTYPCRQQWQNGIRSASTRFCICPSTLFRCKYFPCVHSTHSEAPPQEAIDQDYATAFGMDYTPAPTKRFAGRIHSH
jgi:hypothetical protein